MKKIIAILMFFSLAFTGLAQQDGYRLNFHRDFGFSSGSQVRGKFTVSVVGDLQNVTQVSYRMDGKEFALVTTSPFKYSFNTSEHALGLHELSAVLTLKDATTQETPARRFEFVDQDAEMESVSKIILPLGGGVLLITLLGMGAQFLMLRGGKQIAPGTARNYGFKGGAICTRCGRPFSIHFWSANLGPWKLDRCDNCGKVGLVTRAPLEALRAAEAAEKAAFKESTGAIPAGQATLSSEELQRRQLDDTKYSKD